MRNTFCPVILTISSPADMQCGRRVICITMPVNYSSVFRLATVTTMATLDIIYDIKLEYFCHTSHIHRNNKVSGDALWREVGSRRQPHF